MSIRNVIRQRFAVLARSCALGMCLACLGLSPASAAQQRQAPGRDVRSTSWGRVTGRVYDAVTHEPIIGARLSVRHEGAFADTGRTSGLTDKTGQYNVQALLGRSSENFDIGRALNSGLIGLLVGGATNRTRRLDVTRLDVTVTAESYKPFTGVCRCRASDAGKLAVSMEPILLVREDSDEVSGVADGWGVIGIDTVSVEPSIADPGQEVRLRAVVRTPRTESLKQFDVVASSDVWGKRRLTGDVASWRPSEAEGDRPGCMTFEARVKAPRTRGGAVTIVKFEVKSAPYETARGLQAGSAMAQIVASPEDTERAAMRSSAWNAASRGDTPAALEMWKAVCASPKALEADFLQLAGCAQRMHEDSTAAGALERAVALADERERPDVAARHAEALVRNGQAGQALASYASLIPASGGKAPGKTVSAALLAALGESYLAVGDLDGAARMRHELDRARVLLPMSAVRFRGALRLAEARRSVIAEPDRPESHSALGRTLMDHGRWEEALGSLSTALRMAPEDVGVQSDVEYAVSQLKAAAPEDRENVDASIAEARAQVLWTDGRKQVKSKDFHAWRRLAMLLYVESEQERSASESGRPETLSACIEALEEAIRCARSGARVNEGLYLGFFGYTSPRLVAVSGFAYPEAVSIYTMLTCLRALEADGQDPFALFGLATALIDLQAGRVIDAAVERAGQAWAQDPEYWYLKSLAADARGDGEGAIALLRSVLKANPRHPYANLRLASQLMKLGDTASAATALARHADVYGNAAVPDDEARP